MVITIFALIDIALAEVNVVLAAVIAVLMKMRTPFFNVPHKLRREMYVSSIIQKSAVGNKRWEAIQIAFTDLN